MALEASTTTIEIKRVTLDMLKKYRDPVLDHNWSDAIDKLMNEQGLIYFKLIAIDGELADSSDHEVFFQLGDEPPRYYRYSKGKTDELESLPKMRVEIKT